MYIYIYIYTHVITCHTHISYIRRMRRSAAAHQPAERPLLAAPGTPPRILHDII